MILERFLESDPLGELFSVAKKVRQPFLEHLELQYPNASDAMSAASARMRSRLNFSDDESVRQSAELLEVSFEELKGYLKLSNSMTARLKEVVKYKTLRRSGGALLHYSPVIKIEDGKMPEDSLKPYIVYWSGDWCFPCQLTKPTFARLSHFFDHCPLFYCRDDEFRKAQGVQFVPQLVLYLPNGSKVSSRCGTTTRELWDNLNLLTTLGRGFQGEGTLVCEDGVCRIKLAD